MTDNQNERSRLITWDDPMIVAGASRNATQSGLEFLQALIRGEIPPPPIARLMNMTMSEVSAGRAVFVLQPGEEHYNPIGMVHGGVASTLLDSAMGCAIHSTLAAGVGYTTLELKVNFVRPISHTVGEIRGVGDVIHVGGKVATAQGRIMDAQGKLYAHATTTCMIFQPEKTS